MPMASIRPLFSRSLGITVGFILVAVTGACTDPRRPATNDVHSTGGSELRAQGAGSRPPRV